MKSVSTPHPSATMNALRRRSSSFGFTSVQQRSGGGSSNHHQEHEPQHRTGTRVTPWTSLSTLGRSTSINLDHDVWSGSSWCQVVAMPEVWHPVVRFRESNSEGKSKSIYVSTVRNRNSPVVCAIICNLCHTTPHGYVYKCIFPHFWAPRLLVRYIGLMVL
jgi:hypothetical protein